MTRGLRGGKTPDSLLLLVANLWYMAAKTSLVYVMSQSLVV